MAVSTLLVVLGALILHVVAGVLAGLAANAADAPGVVVAISAAAASMGYFTAWSRHFLRRYRAFQRDYKALFPHPRT